MPSFQTLLAGVCAAAALSMPVLRQAAQPTAPAAGQTYREPIPNTLVTFEMVRVPEGSTTVNGKAVQVAAFYIERTEVTWDMYDVFALGLDVPKGRGQSDAVARPSQPYGAPDYGWGHAGFPAISIASTAAQSFTEWLASRTGKKYRLPTEAEWQRAADLAAGGKLDAAARDALAWHAGNAGQRTHPVGSRKADALGLYDLFGNAAEWVTVPDGDPVTRGGSFRDAADAIGPAARALQDDSWNERDPQLPKSRWWLSDGPFVGFRLVRSDHD
jgi:formylglycine-generating enzyme required for sulfatase activity